MGCGWGPPTLGSSGGGSGLSLETSPLLSGLAVWVPAPGDSRATPGLSPGERPRRGVGAGAGRGGLALLGMGMAPRGWQARLLCPVSYLTTNRPGRAAGGRCTGRTSAGPGPGRALRASGAVPQPGRAPHARGHSWEETGAQSGSRSGVGGCSPPHGAGSLAFETGEEGRDPGATCAQSRARRPHPRASSCDPVVQGDACGAGRCRVPSEC